MSGDSKNGIVLITDTQRKAAELIGNPTVEFVIAGISDEQSKEFAQIVFSMGRPKAIAILRAAANYLEVCDDESEPTP